MKRDETSNRSPGRFRPSNSLIGRTHLPAGTRLAEAGGPAKNARVEGQVVLQVVIGDGGNVKSVNVLEGFQKGLTEAAVAALYDWEFQPATLHGDPVEVYYTRKVDFRLE